MTRTSNVDEVKILCTLGHYDEQLSHANGAYFQGKRMNLRTWWRRYVCYWVCVVLVVFLSSCSCFAIDDIYRLSLINLFCEYLLYVHVCSIHRIQVEYGTYRTLTHIYENLREDEWKRDRAIEIDVHRTIDDYRTHGIHIITKNSSVYAAVLYTYMFVDHVNSHWNMLFNA